jgi:hypothetical protein
VGIRQKLRIRTALVLAGSLDVVEDKQHVEAATHLPLRHPPQGKIP